MTATNHQPNTQKPPLANLPLPAEVFARVIAFLAAGHNGQVILDVHKGKIKAARITEIVRAEDEAA